MSNEALVAAGFGLSRTFNGVWVKEGNKNLKYNQTHGALVFKISDSKTRIWRNINSVKEFVGIVNKQVSILEELANLNTKCTKFAFVNKELPRVISVPMSWQAHYNFLYNSKPFVEYKDVVIPVTFSTSDRIQVF